MREKRYLDCVGAIAVLLGAAFASNVAVLADEGEKQPEKSACANNPAGECQQETSGTPNALYGMLKRELKALATQEAEMRTKCATLPQDSDQQKACLAKMKQIQEDQKEITQLLKTVPQTLPSEKDASTPKKTD